MDSHNSSSNEYTTNSSDATASPMGPALAAFFSALGFSIVAVAAVGNLAILVAFAAVRKLRTHVNYFLASLALSDFVLAVFYLPLEVEYHTRKMFIHSKGVCDFMYMLFFLTITSSSLNLLGVSAYRFVTIRLPYRSDTFATSHVRMVILAIWVYSTLVAFLPLMGWRPMETIVTATDCYYGFAPAYAIFVLAAHWLCPALLGFTLYFVMFRIARSHARRIARTRVLSPADQEKTGLFKCTRTLLKLTAVYAICWFPYVLEVLLVVSKMVPPNQILHYFFVYLCYTNSAINPFLYAGLCGDFREVFSVFLTRSCSEQCNRVFRLKARRAENRSTRSQNATLQTFETTSAHSSFKDIRQQIPV